MEGEKEERSDEVDEKEDERRQSVQANGRMTEERTEGTGGCLDTESSVSVDKMVDKLQDVVLTSPSNPGRSCSDRRLWRKASPAMGRPGERERGMGKDHRMERKEAALTGVEHGEEPTHPSLSPSGSQADTWAPSIPDLSSSSPSPLLFPPSLLSSTSSSSVSPLPSLSPPLPESVELEAVLSGPRLVLDVYRGGADVLPVLWAALPEQLQHLQYLRLGSEEEGALESAISVLPNLTQLSLLAIRGNRFHSPQGDPLPGLLTSLPPPLSSLSLLTHLDLSFNRLASLPCCVLSLGRLAVLLLSCNALRSLPAGLGALRRLHTLGVMGNQLAELPRALGALGALRGLDLSFNRLEKLPEELGLLGALQTLELSNNRLRELPTELGSLLSLTELGIQSNDLRSVPEFVTSLPLLKRLNVEGNPLGRPPTPPPLPLPPPEEEPEIPELHLGLRQHRFSVSPAGCHVFIPGGAELLFPRQCVRAVTELRWAERKLDRKWVQLEEHDFLLSLPLELRPHGFRFEKVVEVCVPYRRSRRREVVLRRFNGQSWATLPTLIRRGSQRHSSQPRHRAWLACCSVTEFSWFVVVSRPVRDTCSVSPQGALLVSSFDPGIKLSFPANATTHTRTVTLQVLEVALSELQQLSGDAQASASPLLCLAQTPSMHFLQPITVQIPLPPGLTGHTVDRSRLHLLHANPEAHTWTDITSQVVLHITHLYAVFSITHFSWYWLWYTTHSCVSGVVRRVYQRLKQFRVQFLVLQRRSDPTQVLLQCLPSDKVESRLRSLAVQYDGPQPSDLSNLLEGEQFFAGFEKGIDIDADRPDCTDGRLAFIFYSHLKNMKEVHVSPSHTQQGTVRGQVSFYRGEVPSSLPDEVARKRKGPDSQWMATLPLRLPGPGSEGSLYGPPQYPPLRLGDPESGYLIEANLRDISRRISHDWRDIGISLGISYAELDRIHYKHRDDLGALVLEMLIHWAKGQQEAGQGAVPRLIGALLESGRRDLAEEVEEIVTSGKRKYEESLKRVGLETETPSTSTPPSQ